MNIDDNELFEKMTGSDKKEKSEKIENEKLKVEKFGFDYYKILSIDRDTNINDIKKNIENCWQNIILTNIKIYQKKKDIQKKNNFN